MSVDSGSHGIFLSYKTEDANVVRSVADALLANGQSVWFAEYMIPLGMFDNDEAVQNAIDRGVDRSACALVFTNNRWASSAFCGAEMERIAEFMLPGRIAEIRIPHEDAPHRKWNILEAAPSLDYRGDPDEVIEFINGLRWLPLPLAAPSLGRSLLKGKRTNLRFGVSLDTGPLVEDDAVTLRVRMRQASMGAGGYPTEMYVFTGTVESRPVQLMIDVNPFQTVLGSLSISARGNSHDRHVYARYRNYVQAWLKAFDQEEKGVHLKFWRGQSHLGTSSRLPGQDEGRCHWERRFALTLRPGVRCYRCGGADVIPYLRDDLTGKAVVPLICHQCGRKQAIPIGRFAMSDLSRCPGCGAAGVDPDDSEMVETGSDYRLLCVAPACERSPGRQCEARMIVPASRMGAVGEVNVSLVVTVDDNENAFAAFARLATLADAIVDSMEYRPASSALGRDDVVPILAAVVAWVVAWAVFDYCKIRYDDPATISACVAFLGFFSMSALAALCLREARKGIVLTGLRWGRRISIPRLWVSRVADQLWQALLGVAVLSILEAVVGLLVIGWVIVSWGIFRGENSLWYWGVGGAMIHAAGLGIRMSATPVAAAKDRTG